MEIECQYYGVEDVAKIMGQSVAWVYLHKDELPPRREIGGVLKWDRTTFDDWRAEDAKGHKAATD